MPKLLPKMVPSWPKGAQMPEEHKGIWRTSNVTKDYFSKPLADPAGPNSHDRVLDTLLDTRRPDKSVLLIGGVNMHVTGTHSSTDNFDKSKLVRGQMNLAVANEQLVLRLTAGVPIHADTNVAELMKRIGQGPDAVPERAQLDDLRIPKNAKGLVMLDYFELTDDKRLDALIAKARKQPDRVFDLMVDPVNEPRETERLSRIQRLVDARLPNLRVWTSKLTLAQQLQHRKVYNELVFHDIPQLSKGGPTTVFTAMAGVVPPPRGDAAKEMAIAARASEGPPPTVAPGGALQFRGLQNLQSLSNKYIERLADWAQPRNLHVRVRGQLFVATDRSFIEAVEHAIEKGGQGEFVVQNLRIPGPDGRMSDINQAGVEALTKVGANVRYFDAKQIPVPGQATDEERKVHSKTFQVEVLDKDGKTVDWRNLSATDRAAWSALWAKSDYPDMPLGPFAIDGSANLSQAAKNKNFELRAMTIGDPKAVAKVGKMLHEPLYNNMSKPVQLARYAKADGVPDLFKRPATRESRLNDPNLVFVATNPIYENDASEIWPIRSALEGNAIVKIGWAHGKLDEAARTKPASEAIVINPGANFAGEPRELATELDKYYGVNQDSARTQPTIDRALDGVVGKLRSLETTQRPVLVTFGAEQRNILDWYNHEGLRENLQNKFQIRSSTVTLDVEEALHALQPKERNIGRRDASAMLGMNPNGTRNDAAAAQILQMLPRVVDKLRAAGQKVDTLSDLERVMRPGAHHWNVKEGMWEEATQ